MSSSQRSSTHILSPHTPLIQKGFAQSRHWHQGLQPAFHPQTQRVPHPEYMYTKNESTKATQAKQSRQTTEPVVPQIKWNTDSIELNGKIHKLPITKDYMLKEYSDVFKGVGTLPG